MNPHQELHAILKNDGARLLRRKKHAIWKLSNGKSFVTAMTPSDVRASANALQDLKGLLGLKT